MRNLSLLLLVSLAFFSCKDDEPSLLTIPIYNLSFTVDPTVQPPLTFYLPINNVQTNTLNMLDGRGIDTSEVKAIVPKNATLSVVFADAKLDFIRDISIRLCPLGDDKENCGREAFWREDIPFNTEYDLGLNGSNVDDLSEILFQEEINVQVKLEELYSPPSGTFNINLDMEFEVR